jgi:membrane associated rhomboid family serine protease
LKPGFLFDWVSLGWVILLAIFYAINAHSELQPAGLMNSAYVARGQWWRLFTAMWLHADLGHLAANAVFGSILLGLAMGRFGTGTGLLAAYLAGAGGNIAAWLFSLEQHRNLGASGMVMGCLGLLAAQSLSLWRSHPSARKFLISSIGAGVMIFILLGLTPGTDVMAHLGGFVSGLIFGWLLLSIPSISRKPIFNLLAALAFTALVLLPWFLAVRHTPL